MKIEEKQAYDFLVNQGCMSIVFEPNGTSKPPDFVIENNIAVEVRRMNKYLEINNQKSPIEKTRYQFVPKFDKLLDELENPDLKFSISVTLRYKRPIIINPKLFELIKESILNTTKNEDFKKEIFVTPQISYELYKAKSRVKRTYYRTITRDMDAASSVNEERFSALKICIEDKTDKLKDLKNNYSELWLILIDDIFSRVNNTTKLYLKSHPVDKSIFKRIFLVSKRDISDYIEI